MYIDYLGINKTTKLQTLLMNKRNFMTQKNFLCVIKMSKS